MVGCVVLGCSAELRDQQQTRAHHSNTLKVLKVTDDFFSGFIILNSLTTQSNMQMMAVDVSNCHCPYEVTTPFFMT